MIIFFHTIWRSSVAASYLPNIIIIIIRYRHYDHRHAHHHHHHRQNQHPQLVIYILLVFSPDDTFPQVLDACTLWDRNDISTSKERGCAPTCKCTDYSCNITIIITKIMPSQSSSSSLMHHDYHNVLSNFSVTSNQPGLYQNAWYQLIFKISDQSNLWICIFCSLDNLEEVEFVHKIGTRTDCIGNSNHLEEFNWECQ